MTRHIGEKENNLVFANAEVVSEITAEVQRRDDLVAKPILTLTQRPCRQQRHLYLAARLLVVLQDTQGVTQFGVALLETVVACFKCPLQTSMIDTPFNRANKQARSLLGFDKKVRGTQTQRGGH